MLAPDLAGYGFPVHLRHGVIQDHKLDGMASEQPQTDPAAAGRDHIVASVLEDEPPCMEPLPVIVNAEDEFFAAGLLGHLG